MLARIRGAARYDAAVVTGKIDGEAASGLVAAELKRLKQTLGEPFYIDPLGSID